MKQAQIDISTGQVTIIDIPDQTLSLDQSKIYQKEIITKSYQQSSLYFQSSALGQAFTYNANEPSAIKFNAEYVYVNSSNFPSGSSINVYTIESGGISHTKDQFNQVWVDGHSYIQSQFNKWDSLMKKIDACTDVASVQAITW